MELVELEARVVELEKRLKELSTSVSINMEWLAEIRELLVQLLQILQKRQKREELAWDKPKSLITETSNASKPKYEAMLDRLWPMIKRDYETQGQGVSA